MMAIDELDKLSDELPMSIKNAPPRWDDIADAARKCGAGEWAMRKWLARGAIPDAWKLRIFQHTGGAISIDEMTLAATPEAAE